MTQMGQEIIKRLRGFLDELEKLPLQNENLLPDQVDLVFIDSFDWRLVNKKTREIITFSKGGEGLWLSDRYYWELSEDENGYQFVTAIKRD